MKITREYYNTDSKTIHSGTKIVFDLVSLNRNISLPKLAAKSRMSVEELDTVLRNLSEEGIIKIKQDNLGFDRIELMEKKVATLLGGGETWQNL